MPFIGVQPASALLTSADIQDGQITTAKVADDAITEAKITHSDITFNGDVTVLGDDLTVGDNTGDSELHLISATDSSGRINFGDSGDANIGVIQYEHDGNDMVFKTNAEEAVRIHSNQSLTVRSSSTMNALISANGGGMVTNAVLGKVSNDNYYCFVGQNNSGTNTFIVYGNGNVQSATNSYGSTSDEKLKENIEDSGSQWDDIKAVKVKKFSLKKDKQSKANMIGVIAQDLEESNMGGLVKDNPDFDENMKDLGTVTKSVKYSILYMKAVKALQEAMTRIETLEAKVAKLEG